jgi:hypothetical protein
MLFCYMYCLRQNIKLQIQSIINISHLLTIYRWLNNNAISVIEDNTFNNLPNLQICEHHLVQKYKHIMHIYI